MVEETPDVASGPGAAVSAPPTPADVLVWSTSAVAELLGGERRARLQALLSREEQARHAAFLRERNKAEFLLAHAAKRIVIARCLGVSPQALAFVTDPLGKPSLATSFGMPRLGFSLSHSDDAVALAVAATPAVGIDVERTARRVAPRALIAALSDREAAIVDRLPEQDRRRRLFAYWTAREAFSKAVGFGLRLPRQDVGFLIADDGDVRVDELDAKHGAWSSWHVRQRWISDDCVVTVTVRAAAGVTPTWRFHDLQDVVSTDGAD